MPSRDRQRLRARLRNAERRLAAAERAQINTASAQYSGHAGTEQGRNTATNELNARIAEASGIEELREEVTRLHAELGNGGAAGLWARLREKLRTSRAGR